MTPPPRLSGATVLRLRDGIVFKRVKNEGVVLVPAENRFLALTEVGARTLELLDGRSSVDVLLHRLLEEYDVGPDRLESDLLDLLGKLLTAGILE